jgi:adenylate kinase
MVKEKLPLSEKIKKYMSNGELVSDDIVIEVLKERLDKDDCRKGFILDGYPRTIEQAKALDNFAKIDAIIHLLVPEWIIIKRLSSRRICRNCGAVYNLRFLKPKKEGICDKCGGELYQRIDDTPKVIKERLKVYERQTQPLLEYYKGKVPFVEFKCETIDLPPDVAVAEILKGLKKLNLS